MPKNCLSVHWNGEEYKADDKGIVDVPEESVVELLSHMCTFVKEVRNTKQKNETLDI